MRGNSKTYEKKNNWEFLISMHKHNKSLFKTLVSSPNYIATSFERLKLNVGNGNLDTTVNAKTAAKTQTRMKMMSNPTNKRSITQYDDTYNILAQTHIMTISWRRERV